MQRFEILHRTYYNFLSPVQLGPHALMLRPREGHDLRVLSAHLTTTPAASLRWHRDAEDNSVAVATFEQATRQLLIESNVLVEQFNESPLDFLVADYAVQYPFVHRPEDAAVLAPYMQLTGNASELAPVDAWALGVWRRGQRIQSAVLLQELASQIQRSITYARRDAPGVQSAATTLSRRTGSCRDMAFLFMQVARSWGLAARFVSGYLNVPPSSADFGATHAWAEVFLPGAGWKGFDPTLGAIVGADHIAVAVSRAPEAVPPVSGSFTGASAGSTIEVGVWVTRSS